LLSGNGPRTRRCKAIGIDDEEEEEEEEEITQLFMAEWHLKTDVRPK
jgi:hypothetical protein